MTLITSSYVDANGLRFAIDEAGEGENVALFLHGFPQSRRCWRHQLPAMAQLGWRAVAPDMRGYGETSRPSGRSAYSVDHLAADVGGLFDALGASRRLLIGHDWGGMVAWSAAARRVRPLDGLVIINAPHPQVYSEVMRRSWRQRLRSLYVLYFALPWLPEALITANNAKEVVTALQRTAGRPDVFPPAILQHYRANAAEPGAMTAMLNYYRANLNVEKYVGGAPGVEAPTLLLWGDNDHALGPELAQNVDEYVSDLETRMLSGIAHWVPEEAPDAVNAAIRDWMAAHHMA